MSTMSRRKMLSLVGGGTVLAATGASAAFLATRTPHAALAPWDRAGSYGDPRLRALSWGLLAPNPHNRQPWQAELRGTDTVAIWRDVARDLPVTDPFARQLTIGMGCFIELTRMAAAQDGLDTEISLFPDGEHGPVATMTFAPGGMPDPLFAHALNRRSHKDAFDRRPLGPEAADLTRHAQIIADGPQLATLRDHAVTAWETEAATPDAWQESIDLLRIGKAEINANPDGIDLGGRLFETLKLLGLLTHENAGDVRNPNVQASIRDTSEAIRSASAMTLTTTPGNTRQDQIAAGVSWLRLNLATTGAGLALRPVSQALQEYPEVAPIRDTLHAQFAPNGETVQMLGLLGYGTRTPRTPRWPLETRLRNA